MAEKAPAPTRPRIPWRALTMVGALAVIWIVFSITTGGTFLMPRNLSLLARQMSVTSILAIGMVLVIVAGQIDLSVGALAGLMGALSAMVYTNRDWPLGAAFLLVLILAWNEYLIAAVLTAGNSRTMPLLVAAQDATRGPQWWAMSVLVLIMILPVIVMAIVLERFISRGILIGAVKG